MCVTILRNFSNNDINVHIAGDLHITLDEIRTADVLAALSSTKPSASKLQAKYMAWQKEFESA